NYGRILQIGDNSIKLREVVQDAAGDWVERMTTLELQEGSK
ncbi:MAG: pilus assembly protein PilP, partial [Comamonas sp.]